MWVTRACSKPIGKRLELVGCKFFWCGQNPDLGVPTPRPPVEERGAAPQTPLHKVWLVGSDSRFSPRRYANALASQGNRSVGEFCWLDSWIGGAVELVGWVARSKTQLTLTLQQSRMLG